MAKHYCLRVIKYLAAKNVHSPCFFIVVFWLNFHTILPVLIKSYRRALPCQVLGYHFQAQEMTERLFVFILHSLFKANKK